MTGEPDSQLGHDRIVAEIHTERTASLGRPETSRRQGNASDDAAPGANVLAETAAASGPWLPLALAVYNLIIGCGVAAALWYVLFRWPGESIDAPGYAQAMTERFLITTMLGASLGTTIHCLLGIHIHFAIVGNFNAKFTGSYVVAPLASMGLGLALFAVLQGGLLALGGNVASPTTSESLRASLFYLAVGVLTGFAWDTVVLRFDSVARQIFGGEGTSAKSGALDTWRSTFHH